MRTTSKARGLAWLSSVAVMISLASALGGCATEGPIAPEGIEQRVLNARTVRDHKDLAATYEQQARLDMASSEMHERLALSYAKSWSPPAPWSHETGKAPAGNQVLVDHCRSLARLYALASSGNRDLAIAHLRAAAVAPAGERP